MRFDQNKGRTSANYQQLDVFDSSAFGASDQEALRSYSKGTRDYARIVDSNTYSGMVEHPMAMGNLPNDQLGFSFSDITGGLTDFYEDTTGSLIELLPDSVGTMIEKALPSADEISRMSADQINTFANTLTSDAAAKFLAQPDVQATITKNAAVAAKAGITAQIAKGYDWVLANRKMVLSVSIGIIGGYFIYKANRKHQLMK